MHHFVTEMCTCVHISVTEWRVVGCLSDALWDLWDGSIPWLLVLWLRSLSGHRQLLYWLFRITCSLPSTRNNFNHPRHHNVENWWKLQTHFYVSRNESNPTMLQFIWCVHYMTLVVHTHKPCHRALLRWREESWWRHEMEKFSALLAICAGNSPAPVKSPHKGQLRGALMFSLISAWING